MHGLAFVAGNKGDPAGSAAYLAEGVPLSRSFGSKEVLEQDVMRLIAEGMSGRQIGEALFISHRIVLRHVANILAKIDVSSRGAASAWYTRQINPG